MMRVASVLLGLVGLVVLWGLAQALLGPESRQEQVERSVRSLWSQVWQQTTREVEQAGWPASARSMARSPQAMILARRLEGMARQAFDPAELVEASSAQARAWMRDFLAVFFAESAGSASPPAQLDLELLEETEAELRFAVVASSGTEELQLELSINYLDGEPHIVRAASLRR